MIKTFKFRSREESDDSNILNDSFGENRKLDRLIIMDDVSGIADVSKKFANFLTVSREFGNNCVCLSCYCCCKPNFTKNYFSN